ncbi:hypothetical protein LguiB_028873 [Lonicera macranthoides]
MYSSENEESCSLYEVLKANMAEQTEFSKGSVAELMALEVIAFSILDVEYMVLFDRKWKIIGNTIKFYGKMEKETSDSSASTQSLFGVLIKILDESIEKKNGEVTNGVARQLKKVLQLMEQRISRQAEDSTPQKILQKSCDEKYQPRTRVLETLAKRTTEENEFVTKKLQQKKTEKTKIEQKKKLEEKNVIRLMKENDDKDGQILALKQAKTELEKKVMELENLLDESRKKVKELEQFFQSKSLSWKRKELSYKTFVDFQFGSLQQLRMGSESIKEEVLKEKKIYLEELNQFGLKLKQLIDASKNYSAVLAENRKLYNEVQDLKGNIRVYCRIRPFLPGQREKQSTIEYAGDNGELVVTNPSKQAKDTRRVFKFNKVFGPAATQEEVFTDTRQLIRSTLDGYNVCIFAYGQTGSGKTYTMTGPNESSKEEWGVNYRALNDLFHLSESRRSSIIYEVSVQMVEIYNEQLVSFDLHTLGISNTTQPNGLAVPDASIHPVKSTADVIELMNIGLMNRAGNLSPSILTVHVRGVNLETNAVLRGSLHLVDLAGSERVDRSEVTGDRLREAQHINKSLSALGDVIFALSQKSSHVPYRNSKLTQVLQGSLGGQAKTLMFIQLNPDAECYSESLSTLKFAERVSGVELGAARSNKEGRGVKELMEQVAILKDTIAKKDEEIGQLRLVKSNGNGEKRLSGSMGYLCPSPRRRSLGAPRPTRSMSAEKISGLVDKTHSNLDNGSSEHRERHSETDSPQSMDFKHQQEFFLQSRVNGVDNGKSSSSEEIGLRASVVDASKNLTEDIELLGFGDADIEERLSDISDSVLSLGTETEGSTNSIVELTLFPETAKLPPPPPMVEHNETPLVEHKEPPPVEHKEPPPVEHKEPPPVEQKEPVEHKEPPPVEYKEPVERKEPSPVVHKEPVEHKEKPSVPAKLPRPPQRPVLTGPSRGPFSKGSPKILPSFKKATSVPSSPIRAVKRWQN